MSREFRSGSVEARLYAAMRSEDRGVKPLLHSDSGWPAGEESRRGLDGFVIVGIRHRRMSARHHSPLIRATAWVAAACVLALAVLAVSPDLHGWFHQHDHHDHAHGAATSHEHGTPVESVDHVCAVTLFAQGIVGLLCFCLLGLGRHFVRPVFLPAVDQVAASYPRYWLVPAHAPPAV